MMNKIISRILYGLFFLYQLMFCIVLVRMIYIHYFCECCCYRLYDCKILKYLFFGSIIILVLAIIIDLINYMICEKSKKNAQNAQNEQNEKSEVEKCWEVLKGETKEEDK